MRGGEWVQFCLSIVLSDEATWYFWSNKYNNKHDVHFWFINVVQQPLSVYKDVEANYIQSKIKV